MLHRMLLFARVASFASTTLPPLPTKQGHKGQNLCCVTLMDCLLDAHTPDWSK